MYCGKCGAKLAENAKFCPKCGTEVTKRENTGDPTEKDTKNDSVTRGQTHETDTDTKQKKQKKNKNRKQPKQPRGGQKPKKKAGKIILLILLLLILLLLLAGLLQYKGVIHVKPLGNLMYHMHIVNEDTINTERPDADEYYSENSKIISETIVTESKNVHTEAEVLSVMTERGFTQAPIRSEYGMDGTMTNPTDAGGTDAKHPSYQTYYESSTGEIWTIMEMNGQMMAYPIIYNAQSGEKVQTIISESETITTYDSEKNKFYEVIPKKKALKVKVIDHIDAAALDQLTAEVIKGL